MYIASPLRQTSKRFLIATVLVLLAATVAVRQTRRAVASRRKLTSILADLVQATASGQLAATPGASLTSSQSMDALPRSVRDAMGSGWLRVDGNGAVQVYVLLSAVNDDTVGQLTAAGATIEIADVQRRRVQARVPVSRLQAVAQLSIVDAIRLPDVPAPAERHLQHRGRCDPALGRRAAATGPRRHRRARGRDFGRAERRLCDGLHVVRRRGRRAD